MLDMGFEEELEALIAETPATRRTHLVSATFGPPRARRRATYSDRRGPSARSASGKGHDDIDQVWMAVRPTDRVAAIINLLLRYPDDKTLVFVRTRSGAQELARALADAGFGAQAPQRRHDAARASRNVRRVSWGVRCGSWLLPTSRPEVSTSTTSGVSFSSIFRKTRKS